MPTEPMPDNSHLSSRQRKAPYKQTPAGGFSPIPEGTPESETARLAGTDRIILRSELSLLDTRNPNKVICGAKKANTDGKELCNNLAGFRTPHLGEGRCYRHGGLSTGRPIIHGKRSKRLRFGLMEEIGRVMSSPDLLTLNRPIAMMKVALDRQIELAALKDEQFAREIETLEAAGISISDPGFDLAKLSRFDVDLDLMKTLVMAIRNSYDMQFSRRFSISIQELGAVIAQIASAFNEIANRHKLPAEAKVDFANAMRGLKTSRPLDTQLEVAGTSESMREPIDAEFSDVEARSSRQDSNNSGRQDSEIIGDDEDEDANDWEAEEDGEEIDGNDATG